MVFGNREILVTRECESEDINIYITPQTVVTFCNAGKLDGLLVVSCKGTVFIFNVKSLNCWCLYCDFLKTFFQLDVMNKNLLDVIKTDSKLKD